MDTPKAHTTALPPHLIGIKENAASKIRRALRSVLDDFDAGLDDFDLQGYCTACGELHEDNVEPDARRYTCSTCGEPCVYGVSELIMMGYA